MKILLEFINDRFNAENNNTTIVISSPITYMKYFDKTLKIDSVMSVNYNRCGLVDKLYVEQLKVARQILNCDFNNINVDVLVYPEIFIPFNMRFSFWSFVAENIDKFKGIVTNCPLCLGSIHLNAKITGYVESNDQKEIRFFDDNLYGATIERCVCTINTSQE